MLWLEMSRDPIHGGGGWDFTKCLWSPTRKQNGAKWAFWETVRRVRMDDTVLHLRGEGPEAAFVGFSTADSDGTETTERPPEPGQWGYATTFYRALLRDFMPLATPIPLQQVFQQRGPRLRAYFAENRAKRGARKKRLFYVIQATRLQCLNGAYLSEVDDELATILLDDEPSPANPTAPPHQVAHDVATRQQLALLKVRIGQSSFSEQVHANYGHQCCFPGCTIDERQFLRGAHITRWTDEPAMRGNISNGLCLCLMHDQAFESGLFTLDLEHRVRVNAVTITNSRWGRDNLLPHLVVQRENS